VSAGRNEHTARPTALRRLIVPIRLRGPVRCPFWPPLPPQEPARCDSVPAITGVQRLLPAQLHIVPAEACPNRGRPGAAGQQV